MRCVKCNHEAGWRRFSTLEKLAHGGECPTCSRRDHDADAARPFVGVPWHLQLVQHEAFTDVWSTQLQVDDLVTMRGPDLESKEKSLEWAHRMLVQLGLLAEGENLPASNVHVERGGGA
jgi:hypothetical protein